METDPVNHMEEDDLLCKDFSSSHEKNKSKATKVSRHGSVTIPIEEWEEMKAQNVYIYRAYRRHCNQTQSVKLKLV